MFTAYRDETESVTDLQLSLVNIPQSDEFELKEQLLASDWEQFTSILDPETNKVSTT